MKRMHVIDFARNCLLMAAVTSLLLADTHARTWTSSDGTKTFEGERESYDAAKGMVTVTLPNGRSITFTQDKLSKADIAFLREDATGAAQSSPPTVRQASSKEVRNTLNAFPNHMPVPIEPFQNKMMIAHGR